MYYLLMTIESQLHYLCYRSKSCLEAPQSASEARQIAMNSSQRNQDNDVTGVLVFRAGYFLQLLEGPEQSLIETLERIRKDKRHKDIRLLSQGPLERRQFGEWGMRSVDANSVEKDILESFLSDVEGAEISPSEPLDLAKTKKRAEASEVKDFLNIFADYKALIQSSGL